jgi:hypothetical protein
MALVYGVVRARPDLAKREDGAATPQLELRAVDASGQPWRVAVNVQSDDGGEQQTLGSPLLANDPAGRSGPDTRFRRAFAGSMIDLCDQIRPV